MTTKAKDIDLSADDKNSLHLEPDLRPIENLSDLVASARRAAAKIPPEERSRMRAVSVAYLDEVAAREPTHLPVDGAE